jgi:hypothetical protein
MTAKRLALMLTFVLVGALVWALPPNEVDTVYYESAEAGDLVGERLLACDGSHLSWGTATAHYATIATSCSSGQTTACGCWVNGVETSCPLSWGVCN